MRKLAKRNYSACLFSDGQDKLSFVLTGRHQTIRADGGAEPNAVFGGPLFYGHAVEFYERPDHPGNVWWHQARLASKVYQALDGKQQAVALVQRGSPADRASSVKLQGVDGRLPIIGHVAPAFSRGQTEPAEKMVRRLHGSLSSEQRKILLLPWSSSRAS